MCSLTLRSILAAADLSAASYEVLESAGALAALTGADLHVVHAFGFDRTPFELAATNPVTFPRMMHNVERTLEEQIQSVVPPEVRIASRRVIQNAPARAILQRASEIGADLVVLGPHCTRRLGDRFLGGTADRVVRNSAIPCLIVHRALSMPVRRVVAPVDLAEPSSKAVEHALTWSTALAPRTSGDPLPETQVRVLHVLPPFAQARENRYVHAVVGPDLRHEIEQAMQRVPGASRLDVREEMIWGDDPAVAIAAFADREQADLLVLGTHGYGPARRALFGSVSSAVACDVAAAVLLLPPALWREEPAQVMAPAEMAAWEAPYPL